MPSNVQQPFVAVGEYRSLKALGQDFSYAFTPYSGPVSNYR